MITLNDVLWTNDDENEIGNQADISTQSSDVMTIEMCCWRPKYNGPNVGWPTGGQP